MRFFPLLIAGMLCTGLFTASKAQTMYFLDCCANHNLYTIDVSTGAGTLVGATGLSGSAVLVGDDNTQQLYAVTFNAQLHSINRSTGASTLIGDIDIVSPSFKNVTAVEAMTFNPADGKLYASAKVGAGTALTPTIITIDPATANATELGNMGLDNDRMFFAPDGNFYTIDFPTLFRVSLPGLSRTTLGSLATGLGLGWAQDPDSTAFMYATYLTGGQLNLAKVNYNTRQIISIVGPMGINSTNGELTFLSPSSNNASVPTLSQWGMIILGLIVLCAGAIAIRTRHTLAAESNP